MTVDPGNCTVEELARRRQQGEAPAVLDVRNDEELALASIGDVIHIPMPEVPERIAELDSWRDQELVIMCHHGMRSMRVATWLCENGFSNIRNLQGGIHAWSLQVDDTVPVYE